MLTGSFDRYNTNCVLQWNVNGYIAKLPRLQSLVESLGPKVLALQELKVRASSSIYLQGYTIYKKCRLGMGGGVCLAVHNSVPSVEIPLNTDLEAVACTLFFKNFNLSICNVYFNAEADVSLASLDNLLTVVPAPRLLLGDVNAKHFSWGSPICDGRGVVINRFLSRANLFLLNDGSPTYFNMHTNYYSHLDISCVSDTVSHNFAWRTYPDALSSDHFPVIIRYTADHHYVTKPSKWLLDKANWTGYRSSLEFPAELSAVMDPGFASIQMPAGFADENSLHTEIVNPLWFKFSLTEIKHFNMIF